jgi:hypothetical protein
MATTGKISSNEGLEARLVPWISVGFRADVFLLFFTAHAAGNSHNAGFFRDTICHASIDSAVGYKVGWWRAMVVLLGFSGVVMVMQPSQDAFGWVTLLPIAYCLLPIAY